ncbi:MAG TPA: glycosyltransferase family 39 protein [Streptosporangiaceae bacterium]|nr:glycosyltransferase family 39 protein [Streptosporangiaceae bacterium]
MPEQDLQAAMNAEGGSPPEARVPATGRRGDQAGWPWEALIPAVVTFEVTLFEITRPSFWQDEATTLADTERTLPQLFALLGRTDAVHGTYYVLMWFVIRVAGTGEFAVRFPSAVAMAVAAGGIGLLGKRLVSRRAGLAAGLVFAVIPQVSFYGQNAREYAMVAAVATIASYLFVRAVQAPEDARAVQATQNARAVQAPRHARGAQARQNARRDRVNRWLVGYGISLAVLGLLNLFALLLIPAHALALAARARRDAAGEPPADAAAHLLVRSWLMAVVAALVVCSPVVFFGWRQRGQIGWLKAADLGDVIRLEKLIGPGTVLAAALIIIAAGIVVSATRGRTRLRADWPQRLVVLCVPWLVLPPAVLLAVSVAYPVYVFRYVVFCIPAAALLVGTALAALGRAAGTLALIVVVALALPAQAAVRGPASHGENLRAISQYLAEHAHRGDSVLFASFYERKIEIAYPAGFRKLRDISFGESAITTNRAVAPNAPTAVISQRLATVSRVWLVRRLRRREPGHRQVLPPLVQLGFKLVLSKAISKYQVLLWVRTGN